MAKSVSELKQELMDLGLDKEKVNACNKKELLELLNSVYKVSESLDTVEITQDLNVIPQDEETQIIVSNEVPQMYDPAWTDYVMSFFQEYELDNGSPKVDGLRRIATKFLGDFSSITEVHQVPSVENAGRASVAVRLKFPNGIEIYGVADVYSGNTSREFAIHPLATAESRAEGRALRKALKLTKVLTAEEAKKPDTDEANGTDSRIQTGMINSLRVMCSSVGVSLLKVAVSLGFNVPADEDLTQEQGLQIANELSKYKRKPESIPAEVK